VIDIHCHILPEVDDGAKSWDVALAMFRMAHEDGIEHIVATPHAHERWPYDRERMLLLLGELRRRAGNGPTLSLGCDFHFSYENLQALERKPQDFLIENTPYLLVEFSNYSVPPQMDDMLVRLGDLGITPVITHPERNPILQQNLRRVARWAEMGCAVQVTASALLGSWGERPQQAAETLLERNAVHVIASDGHDISRRRPILSEGRAALAELYDETVAKALVDDNPRAIVSGQPLPYFPDPVVKA
jgi:protein-tyrosine phosphatase